MPEIRGEIKATIRRANGSHKGERTIGVSITQEIGVQIVKFDQPIVVRNGETLSIEGEINERLI